MIEFLGIPGREILSAIRSAAPKGLEVRVFVGMARNCYNEVLQPVLDECVTWDGLAGIDLHGVEYLPLEDWSPKLWNKARAHGLETKAHAGEFDGANKVPKQLNCSALNAYNTVSVRLRTMPLWNLPWRLMLLSTYAQSVM